MRQIKEIGGRMEEWGTEFSVSCFRCMTRGEMWQYF